MTPDQIAEIVSEIRRLRKWKMDILNGLDEIGRALGVQPGKRITARSTVDTALDLKTERNKLQAAVDMVRELHSLDDTYLCSEDGEIYPCPTIRALDVHLGGGG